MNLDKFFWDVDGVMKRLDYLVLGKDANTWEETRNGKNVIELVNENPEIVLQAEATEYVDRINQLYRGKTLHIITSQRPTWRPYNEKWLYLHLKCAFDIQYTNNARDKLRLLKPGEYLIDDSPLFPDFRQVILIDKKYNRHLMVPTRVHNPDALEACLKRI